MSPTWCHLTILSSLIIWPSKLWSLVSQQKSHSILNKIFIVGLSLKCSTFCKDTDKSLVDKSLVDMLPCASQNCWSMLRLIQCDGTARKNLDNNGQLQNKVSAWNPWMATSSSSSLDLILVHCTQIDDVISKSRDLTLQCTWQITSGPALSCLVWH